jgi:hypothetical protein
VFDFIFDFLTWQELGNFTRLSKYYYSNILVRCRHMFVNHRIGLSNATINNNMDENDLKVAFSDAQDLFLNRGNSKDEMFLYSEDYSAIRFIYFPSLYQSSLDTVANE